MVLVVGQRGHVDKGMMDRPAELDAEAVAALERRSRSVQDKTRPEAQAEALKAAAVRRRDRA